MEGHDHSTRKIAAPQPHHLVLHREIFMTRKMLLMVNLDLQDWKLGIGLYLHTVCIAETCLEMEAIYLPLQSVVMALMYIT